MEQKKAKALTLGVIKQYNARYKCRNCGLDMHGSLPRVFTKSSARIEMEKAILGGGNPKPMDLLRLHYCESGDIGIASLVGFTAVYQLTKSAEVVDPPVEDTAPVEDTPSAEKPKERVKRSIINLEKK